VHTTGFFLKPQRQFLPRKWQLQDVCKNSNFQIFKSCPTSQEMFKDSDQHWLPQVKSWRSDPMNPMNFPFRAESSDLFSERQEESKTTPRVVLFEYDMMCQGCLYHFILNSALTLHIFWLKRHHDWLPDFPYQSASNLKENTSAMSSTASTKVVVNMILFGSHKNYPSPRSDHTKTWLGHEKHTPLSLLLS